MKIIINQSLELDTFLLSNQFFIKQSGKEIVIPEIQGSIIFYPDDAQTLWNYLQESTTALNELLLILENGTEHLLSFYLCDVQINPENGVVKILKLYPEKKMHIFLERLNISFKGEVQSDEIHLHNGVDSYPDELIRNGYKLEQIIQYFKDLLPFETEILIPEEMLRYMILSNLHIQNPDLYPYLAFNLRDIFIRLSRIYQVKWLLKNEEGIIKLEILNTELENFFHIMDDDILSNSMAQVPLEKVSTFSIRELGFIENFVHSTELGGVYIQDNPFVLQNKSIYDAFQYPDLHLIPTLIFVQFMEIDEVYFSAQNENGKYNPDFIQGILFQKLELDVFPGLYSSLLQDEQITFPDYTFRKGFNFSIISEENNLSVGSIFTYNTQFYEVISIEMDINKPILKIKSISI